MKKLLIGLGIALTLASNGLGQQPTPQTLTLQAPSPSSPTNIGANVVGASGGTIYYYWVVAKYPIGNSTVFGPATVFNGPNTLSGTNYITVSWSSTVDATGYDLLRTTTNTVPSGTATIQVPTGSTVATSWNDTGGALGSYTVATVSGVTGIMGLDNLHATRPIFGFSQAILAPTYYGDGSNLTGIVILPTRTSIVSTSPVAISASGYYFNNSVGAITFNLPTIVTGTIGSKYCFRNYTTRTGVITIQAPAATTIDVDGAINSTPGNTTSGGALGDSVCVIASDVGKYILFVGIGTWTNN